MALDLSRLHDAIGKVADLAQDHAELQRAHGDVVVLAAQHKAELEQAQKDVDALVDQLVAAATAPAEKVGIQAVADAILTQASTVGSLAAPEVPADAIVEPVAPVMLPTTSVMPPLVFAPVAPPVVGTFLPGDPRAK